MADNYIKKLKPRKNGRFHQGVIDPKHTTKYYSSVMDQPIIYRSGLELQFIQYCENNIKVAKWASEPIEIKYFNRLKNKEARYYPDYVIENTNGDRVIVEVKPCNQCQKPDATDSQWLKEAWVTNMDKWAAAKKFAEDRGMKFIIVTEKFFE
jgi:hypothetical protein